MPQATEVAEGSAPRASRGPCASCGRGIFAHRVALVRLSPQCAAFGTPAQARQHAAGAVNYRSSGVDPEGWG